MTMIIHLNVNRQQHRLDLEPGTRLLDALRDHLGLTGTKRGCDIGECGACTVLLDGLAVNSCLVLAVQADGRAVTTVEGLAGGGRLSALQEAFLDHDAVHCGFCTPGMLMSARELLDRRIEPDADGIRTAIAGNLCRCTGYVQIVDAIADAARREETARTAGEEQR